MTRQEAGSRAVEFMKKVPVAWVALSTLVGAVGFGGVAARNLDAQRELPDRVKALEIWKDSTVSPAIHFLVCSQRAENSGNDPKACDVLLEGVNDLLRPRRE